MLNSLVEERIEIFDTFEVAVKDIQFEDTARWVEEYFSKRENKTNLRYCFLNLKQSQGEVNDYIQQVLKLSHSCQLEGLQEDLAIHVMINGMTNEKLKTELL